MHQHTLRTCPSLAWAHKYIERSHADGCVKQPQSSQFLTFIITMMWDLGVSRSSHAHTKPLRMQRLTICQRVITMRMPVPYIQETQSPLQALIHGDLLCTCKLGIYSLVLLLVRKKHKSHAQIMLFITDQFILGCFSLPV